MSMTGFTCPNCWASYDYYQILRIVPRCRKCGADACTGRPLTREEFYSGFGSMQVFEEEKCTTKN